MMTCCVPTYPSHVQDVGSPGVTDVKQFKLIPGSAAAIAALNAAGCHVCVVTNQSCIGKGLLTPEVLVLCNASSDNVLPVSSVLDGCEVLVVSIAPTAFKDALSC